MRYGTGKVCDAGLVRRHADVVSVLWKLVSCSHNEIRWYERCTYLPVVDSSVCNGYMGYIELSPRPFGADTLTAGGNSAMDEVRIYNPHMRGTGTCIRAL